MHADAPLDEYEPTGQVVDAVEPAGQYDPAEHTSHSYDPPDKMLLAAHAQYESRNYNCIFKHGIVRNARSLELSLSAKP